MGGSGGRSAARDAGEMFVDIEIVEMVDIGVFCVSTLAASERRLFVVYKNRG